MPKSKPRTNRPLLCHKMTNEQCAGFEFAFKYGARNTAISIRAGKASLGQAVVNACREIGTEQVVGALIDAQNPEWSLCAIRYAPEITQVQRELLVKTLTERWFDQAQWALENMSHWSDEERAVLKWVAQQR